MQATPTAARPAAVRLNRQKLDELRRAHGISTEAELARVIGVDTATLWRASSKSPPSNAVIAKILIAFPAADFRSLFVVEAAA
ncbi:helix-turn-helix transcriptional regulator [Frigoribacterium sp. CFBP9030]|uniref:helix-turn-helix domain-containing protein n=1 Tax=Frigoribacterium sp. CFBP9030 TaxID=3096537 RepID=UPI002A6AA1D4|nr:helix-turn-helix transcriptional regulator [Frigoribacterium sp. CFBP9030]MDY0891837.1 helix-turn-helix transcriptional regulator [Frigoribacterium sp. CFBP9030]